MKMIEELTKFLESSIKLLVDNPDEVHVNITTSTKSIMGQIKVARSDFGKVIGRKGKTIESLKIISTAVKNTNFSEDTRNVTLEILEDEHQNFKSVAR
jgi:uncharacterized protein